MHKLSTLAFAALLSSVGLSQSTTESWVDPVSGSDLGGGTMDAPYKTIGRALQDAAIPGPLVIRLSPGEYSDNPLTGNGESFPLIVPTRNSLGSVYILGSGKGYTTIATDGSAQILHVTLGAGGLTLEDLSLEHGTGTYSMKVVSDAFDQTGQVDVRRVGFSSENSAIHFRCFGAFTAATSYALHVEDSHFLTGAASSTGSGTGASAVFAESLGGALVDLDIERSRIMASANAHFPLVDLKAYPSSGVTPSSIDASFSDMATFGGQHVLRADEAEAGASIECLYEHCSFSGADSPYDPETWSALDPCGTIFDVLGSGKGQADHTFIRTLFHGNNIVGLCSSASEDLPTFDSSHYIVNNCFVDDWPGHGVAPGNQWGVDPMWVSPQSGDFHLKPDSPALDWTIGLSGSDYDTASPGSTCAYGAIDLGADQFLDHFLYSPDQLAGRVAGHSGGQVIFNLIGTTGESYSLAAGIPTTSTWSLDCSGTWHLVPGTAFMLGQGTIGSDGVGSLACPVPSDPGLIGLTLAVQAAFGPTLQPSVSYVKVQIVP